MELTTLNNKLGIYEYINDGFLRVVGTKEEPWFNAKDIATILGYKDTNQAIRKNVDLEDRNQLEEIDPSIRPSLVNQPHSTYINESGLYSLLIKSRLPEAKKFKRWVTSEVLPSIRKTGFYNIQQPKDREQIELENYEKLVGIFKSLNMDDRDELLLRDYARNKFLLKNGNERELPLISQQYSVSRRLQEQYGLQGKMVSKLYCKLGKELAHKYREEYKTQPPQNESFVNGAVRMVNCYFNDFWTEFGDDILEDVYGEFLTIEYIE